MNLRRAHRYKKRHVLWGGHHSFDVWIGSAEDRASQVWMRIGAGATRMERAAGRAAHHASDEAVLVFVEAYKAARRRRH